MLDRIATWLSLASVEESDKFKDVFRRLKKHIAQTTYSSFWLETSPKYQRSRIYQENTDAKEFASRKFVLPGTSIEKPDITLRRCNYCKKDNGKTRRRRKVEVGKIVHRK